MLCASFLPRPVRDNVDYENVAKVADKMALSRDEFTPDQADHFELLCTLLEEYDSKNVTWPKVSGVNLLKHLLEEQSLGPADLSRILGGSRNLGAMILRGERELTVKHIGTLTDRFRISADALLA